METTVEANALAAQIAALITAAQVATTPPPREPQVPTLFTVPEAAKHLRCAESTVWQLLRAGELRSTRVGRRRFIPADAITEYLAGMSA
ncbi:helix-turn-helix domain-containing protein [Mycobacterium marinum]|uniref:helix-turn-helix domain-containing protein n=1 Tax=Mycobacterium marinum TaxID=1781 RepID=UPI0023590236|nr:helix-turn-helix domain-containing protein [Mycobacterium marinum]WCS17761.1 helix-turn-helix domain-containing protein [Mycobacterium marinum]